MVLHHDASEAVASAPGVTRRVLVHGPQLMLVEFILEGGRDLAVHTHPHEQVGYIVSGRLRLSLDGVFHELGPGDSYHVMPKIPHGVTIRETATVIDAFTPPREDFLKG